MDNTSWTGCSSVMFTDMNNDGPGPAQHAKWFLRALSQIKIHMLQSTHLVEFQRIFKFFCVFLPIFIYLKLMINSA